MYPLAISEGEGLTIPIKLFGEIGFYDLRSALVLVIPLAADGPRVRVGRSGERVAEYDVRLKPGMRKAVPLGGFGELGVEVG